MNPKRARFVAEYLKCFSAAEAARRAGYSAKTAYSFGPQLLRIIEVARAIEEGIRAAQVGTDEALMILAAHARGDIGEFMDVTAAGFALSLVDRAEDGTITRKVNTRLIKKIRQRVTTRIGKGPHDDDIETIDTEIELYSAQDALDKILRAAGAYKDHLEVTSTIQTDEDVQRLIGKVYNANPDPNPSS